MDSLQLFNCDETNFFLKPKGTKVLAGKGDKTIYQQVSSDDKECLTVLITGNANGSVVTPLVAYKYERLLPEIMLNFPSGWALGKSDSGWNQPYLGLQDIKKKLLCRMLCRMTTYVHV